MTPDDRYHFEPLLLSVESAIGRGEETGSYHHSEIRRLLRSAFDCGDHYIAGYKQGRAAPDTRLTEALRAAAMEAHEWGADHESVPFDECRYEPCRQRRRALSEAPPTPEAEPA